MKLVVRMAYLVYSLNSLVCICEGFRNVLSWFGEMNIPSGFSEDCTTWKVKVVKIYPDLDDTGFLINSHCISQFLLRS